MKYHVGTIRYKGTVKCYSQEQLSQIQSEYKSTVFLHASIYVGPNNNDFRKFIKTDYILHYWLNMRDNIQSWETGKDWQVVYWNGYGAKQVEDFNGQISKYQKRWNQITEKHPEYLY